MNPAETLTPVRRPPAWRRGQRASNARRPPAPPARAPPARTAPGRSPRAAPPRRSSPRRPGTLRATWYSVTVGGGGGAASNTCRFCTLVTAASARSAPQAPQAAGPHSTVSSGSAGLPPAWRTARPAACPACARTYPAATGPAASSDTGYPTRAASTTWTSPCPGGAAILPSAPPAPPASPAPPQSAHPWPPAAPPPPPAERPALPAAPQAQLPGHAATATPHPRRQATAFRHKRHVGDLSRRSSRHALQHHDCSRSDSHSSAEPG